MKDRLLKFIEFLNINPALFEKKVELSNGFVNNIGASVREKTIKKIESVYPELNINWWKTGEGNMLKNNIDHISKFKSSPEVQQLLKLLDENQNLQIELAERLKISQNQLTESQKQITTLLEILKNT